MSVTCPRAVAEAAAVTEGARVILRARPDFYAERGTLSLRATEIRQVGIGELLARLEQLKRLLAAEGVFAAERKRRLPFLPRTVGLITGRASAAERDVVENAGRRFPGVRFRIENTATQGTSAVSEVTAALQRLDADPLVDVIVIARGGGSLEDLLPFSNETLIRAVAACRTPVVSAIGHETDTPLLDFVADVACSTPTDAAKRIVPDLAEELGLVADLHRRVRSSVERRLRRERELIAGLPHRLRASTLGLLERAREACDHLSPAHPQPDRGPHRRCRGRCRPSARPRAGAVAALDAGARVRRGGHRRRAGGARTGGGRRAAHRLRRARILQRARRPARRSRTARRRARRRAR